MFSSIPCLNRASMSWKSCSSSPVGSSSCTFMRVSRVSSSSSIIAPRSTKSSPDPASSRTGIFPSLARTFLSRVSTRPSGVEDNIARAALARSDWRSCPPTRCSTAPDSPFQLVDGRCRRRIPNAREHQRAGHSALVDDPLDSQVDKLRLPPALDDGAVVVGLHPIGVGALFVDRERLVVHLMAPLGRRSIEIRLELERRGFPPPPSPHRRRGRPGGGLLALRGAPGGGEGACPPRAP